MLEEAANENVLLICHIRLKPGYLECYNLK